MNVEMPKITPSTSNCININIRTSHRKWARRRPNRRDESIVFNSERQYSCSSSRVDKRKLVAKGESARSYAPFKRPNGRLNGGQSRSKMIQQTRQLVRQSWIIFHSIICFLCCTTSLLAEKCFEIYNRNIGSIELICSQTINWFWARNGSNGSNSNNNGRSANESLAGKREQEVGEKIPSQGPSQALKGNCESIQIPLASLKVAISTLQRRARRAKQVQFSCLCSGNTKPDVIVALPANQQQQHREQEFELNYHNQLLLAAGWWNYYYYYLNLITIDSRSWLRIIIKKLPATTKVNRRKFIIIITLMSNSKRRKWSLLEHWQKINRKSHYHYHNYNSYHYCHHYHCHTSCHEEVANGHNRLTKDTGCDPIMLHNGTKTATITLRSPLIMSPRIEPPSTNYSGPEVMVAGSGRLEKAELPLRLASDYVVGLSSEQSGGQQQRAISRVRIVGGLKLITPVGCLSLSLRKARGGALFSCLKQMRPSLFFGATIEFSDGSCWSEYLTKEGRVFSLVVVPIICDLTQSRNGLELTGEQPEVQDVGAQNVGVARNHGGRKGEERDNEDLNGCFELDELRIDFCDGRGPPTAGRRRGIEAKLEQQSDSCSCCCLASYSASVVYLVICVPLEWIRFIQLLLLLVVVDLVVTVGQTGNKLTLSHINDYVAKLLQHTSNSIWHIAAKRQNPRRHQSNNNSSSSSSSSPNNGPMQIAPNKQNNANICVKQLGGYPPPHPSCRLRLEFICIDCNQQPNLRIAEPETERLPTPAISFIRVQIFRLAHYFRWHSGDSAGSDGDGNGGARQHCERSHEEPMEVATYWRRSAAGWCCYYRYYYYYYYHHYHAIARSGSGGGRSSNGNNSNHYDDDDSDVPQSRQAKHRVPSDICAIEMRTPSVTMRQMELSLGSKLITDQNCSSNSNNNKRAAKGSHNKLALHSNCDNFNSNPNLNSNPESSSDHCDHSRREPEPTPAHCTPAAEGQPRPSAWWACLICVPPCLEADGFLGPTKYSGGGVGESSCRFGAKLFSLVSMVLGLVVAASSALCSAEQLIEPGAVGPKLEWPAPPLPWPSIIGSHASLATDLAGYAGQHDDEYPPNLGSRLFAPDNSNNDSGLASNNNNIERPEYNLSYSSSYAYSDNNDNSNNNVYDYGYDDEYDKTRNKTTKREESPPRNSRRGRRLYEHYNSRASLLRFDKISSAEEEPVDDDQESDGKTIAAERSKLARQLVRASSGSIMAPPIANGVEPKAIISLATLEKEPARRRKFAKFHTGSAGGGAGCRNGGHSGHDYVNCSVAKRRHTKDRWPSSWKVKPARRDVIGNFGQLIDKIGATTMRLRVKRQNGPNLQQRKQQQQLNRQSAHRRLTYGGNQALVIPAPLTTIGRQHRLQQPMTTSDTLVVPSNWPHSGALGVATTSGQNCPTEFCQCVWKNGKQFADCSSATHRSPPPQIERQSPQQQHQGLDKIPSGLDPLLQVLNLSANSISELPELAFVSLNLNNLQRIYLSHNGLESIHMRAFDNLKLVVELDFSWNKLVRVPLPQIRHLTLLRRLSMRGNALHQLTEATFTLSGEPQTEIKSKSPEPEGELASNRSLANNLGRMYETYPDLMGVLLSSSQQLDSNSINKNTETIYNYAHSSSTSGLSLSQLEMETLLFIVQSNDNAETIDIVDETLGENSLESTVFVPMGSLFGQLQELDFGHCSLRYIKWNTLRNLNQLKRLLLDGNQLSQLSGKLLSSLPVGLHQLNLEENLWHCDCRLLALKRWLASTRTPLGAPVRCHWPKSRHQLTEATRSERRLYRRHSSGTLSKKPTRQFSASTPIEIEMSTSVAASNNRKPPTQSQWQMDQNGAHIDKLANQTDDTSKFRSKVLVFNSNNNNNNKRRRWRRSRMGRHENQIDKLQDFYLDQLELEDFVCAPQAMSNQLSPELPAADASRWWTPTTISRQQTDGDNSKSKLDSSKADLAAINEYLGPTLVQSTPQASNLAKSWAKNSSTSRLVSHRKETVQVNEDDKVELRCAFLVYPESSLDIIWLADYSFHSSPTSFSGPANINDTTSASSPPQTVSRLPGEERFVVLYDSKHHRHSAANSAPSHRPETVSVSGFGSAADDSSSPSSTSSSHQISTPDSATINSIDWATQSGRLTIKETRAINPAESVLKESQIIIQAARLEDSARYKCIGLNGAGNSSIEYRLRVLRSASSTALSQELGQHIAPSATTRDQRAHATNTPRHQLTAESFNKARTLASSHLPVAVPPAPAVTQSTSTAQAQPSSSPWLRGSTAFQVIIVLVSILMAAVIFAFVIVCVAIYQIKPESDANLSLARQTLPTAENSNGNGGSFWPLSAGLRKMSANLNNHLFANHQPEMKIHTNGHPKPITMAAITTVDPITGQTPLHLLAHSISELSSGPTLLQCQTIPQATNESCFAVWDGQQTRTLMGQRQPQQQQQQLYQPNNMTNPVHQPVNNQMSPTGYPIQ